MNRVLMKSLRQPADLSRVVTLFLVGLGAALIAACGGGSAPIDITNLERPQGFTGGPPFAAWWPPDWPKPTYVIRTTAQWQTAWDGRNFENGDMANPPIPSIDFSNYMLLGINLGAGRGCIAPRITHVRQVGDELLVDSQLVNVKSTNGLCGFESGAPIDFVQIPQTDLPVRFTPMAAVMKQ